MHTAIAKSTTAVKPIPLAPAFRSRCVTRITWHTLFQRAKPTASRRLANTDLALLFQAQRNDAEKA
jgi:hypothetical protein